MGGWSRLRGDDEAQNVGVIYIGYGELMRRLQVLELSLWIVQAMRMKKGMSGEQAFRQIDKWDGTTFGTMWRGMRTQDHWPTDLVDDVDQAVQLRNHLAHHFLREFFSARKTPGNFERGTQQLIEWSVRMDGLEMKLDAHLQMLGVAAPT